MMKIILMILIFLLAFSLVFLLANSIVFEMAKSICEESEVQPIRYEFSGLFGVKTLIPTTEGNHDAYEKVCIKTGTPKFWSISDNLEYIFEKSVEDLE